MKFEWQQVRATATARRQVTLRDFLSSEVVVHPLTPALALPINPSFPPIHRHVRFSFDLR